MFCVGYTICIALYMHAPLLLEVHFLKSVRLAYVMNMYFYRGTMTDNAFEID